MTRCDHHLFTLMILTMFLCLSPQAMASKKKMDALKATIAQEQKQQAKLKANLQKEDLAVNSLNKQLKSTNKKLKKQTQEVQKLSSESKSLKGAIESQKKQIKSFLISAYKLRKHPTLRLLLSHENPNTLKRHLHYLDTLNITNVHMMSAMKTSIDQLSKAEKQMISYKKALEATKTRQNKERQHLQRAKQQREKKLKALTASIASKQKQLEQMKKDHRELEHIVAKVKTNQQSASSPRLFTKHSLPHPCKGRISQHFGESIQHSQLKTQGIVIQGDEGDPIYAIADGQVVFANWLSGFGLLLIIDHHNGFLSLYGRNDSLDVEAGDTLKQGDKIAAMGKSGAFDRVGLYFALRQGDQSIDPESMLEQD